MSAEQNKRVRALWLCGVLHAFTHVYHVALMPLYFLIQQDFRLASLGKATLLVTVMMVAYFIPSYPVGVLADRISRKKLLTLGLLFNALGFIGLGLAPNYRFGLVSVMVAGIGGSFFHPAGFHRNEHGDTGLLIFTAGPPFFPAKHWFCNRVDLSDGDHQQSVDWLTQRPWAHSLGLHHSFGGRVGSWNFSAFAKNGAHSGIDDVRILFARELPGD